MSDYRLTALVQSLPSTVPFVGPETQERQLGRTFRARLGANESVFGPAPKALEIMQNEAALTWQYADPENHELKTALADKHGVSPDNIVVGEGIDGLLGYLVRMFVEPGRHVVTSDGAYPTFNYHVAGFGGTLHKVPYRDDHEDTEALIAKATEVSAALIYFSNPDNPMGTWHSAETVKAMIEAMPEGSLLILDEAYCEFAPADALPAIDVSIPHVIRFRTFSKAHGMAGARIGYGIAPAELALAFNKIRNHFGVNRLAQSAALASLEDEAHLQNVIAQVESSRQAMADIARQHGLTPLASATNFLTIDCGRDGDYARAVLAALIELGIFVRMPAVPPLDRCIRVTIGTEEDVAVFADALPKALAAAGA